MALSEQKVDDANERPLRTARVTEQEEGHVSSHIDNTVDDLGSGPAATVDGKAPSSHTETSPERRSEKYISTPHVIDEKATGEPPHGLHGEVLVGFQPLDYGLHHKRRRLKIAGYFLLLFVESCLMPEALFYGLTFGTTTHLQITFAIITALCGTFSPLRMWLGLFRLWWWKTTDRCRPLGQENRLDFDFFHITTAIGFWIFIIILIIGTAPHAQIAPLISMAAPSFVFWEGCVLLFVQVHCHLGAVAPFRISSTAKGEPVPAAVYPFIEDIVAVEGHGNRPYRQRLRARYASSPVFRHMLVQLSWFWIVGCFSCTAACAAIVGSTKWYIGYGFGFGLPYLWATVWALATIAWVSRSLKREKATWPVAGPTP